MIVCADEGFRKKNALSDREKKIRPDTFKDEFCQAVYITCLKRGDTLESLKLYGQISENSNTISKEYSGSILQNIKR